MHPVTEGSHGPDMRQVIVYELLAVLPWSRFPRITIRMKLEREPNHCPLVLMIGNFGNVISLQEVLTKGLHESKRPKALL